MDVATLQYLGSRPVQQDAVAIHEMNARVGLLVMADGHGRDGRDASDLAVATTLEQLDGGADAPAAFAAAHARVVADGLEGGCTLTVATLSADTLTVAWAGNTEARLTRVDGPFRTLTIPHEYGVHRGERRRLDGMGAPIDHGSTHGWDLETRRTRGRVRVGDVSLEVTRCIGDPEFAPWVIPDPELVTATRSPEHRWLIMATDGLWQAAARGSKRRRLEEALDGASSVDDAIGRLGAVIANWSLEDNTTIAVVGL